MKTKCQRWTIVTIKSERQNGLQPSNLFCWTFLTWKGFDGGQSTVLSLRAACHTHYSSVLHNLVVLWAVPCADTSHSCKIATEVLNKNGDMNTMASRGSSTPLHQIHVLADKLCSKLLFTCPSHYFDILVKTRQNHTVCVVPSSVLTSAFYLNLGQGFWVALDRSLPVGLTLF